MVEMKTKKLTERIKKSFEWIEGFPIIMAGGMLILGLYTIGNGIYKCNLSKPAKVKKLVEKYVDFTGCNPIIYKDGVKYIFESVPRISNGLWVLRAPSLNVEIKKDGNSFLVKDRSIGNLTWENWNEVVFDNDSTKKFSSLNPNIKKEINQEYDKALEIALKTKFYKNRKK